MDLHFKEDGILALAAQKSELSRRRFNDLFKQQYGITPNDYLTDLKIKHFKACNVNSVEY